MVGKEELYLQLVDTAMQDTALPHSFMRVCHIHGSILVCSVTSLWSWEVRTDEGKKMAEAWGAIFLKSPAKGSQVTMGIFMELIEEIHRLDNSYGRSTSCCLL